MGEDEDHRSRPHYASIGNPARTYQELYSRIKEQQRYLFADRTSSANSLALSAIRFARKC